MMCDQLVADIINYYASVKGYLFVTSITVGAFLFTMKTFIIQTMKKEVYDTSAYGEKYTSAKITNKKLTRYRQLNRLRLFLFLAVAFTLGSGLIQLVLGFFVNIYTVLVCFFIAFVSWVMVFIALILVNNNLKYMLIYSDALVKLKKEDK
ncbi:hypothetical protein [Pseudoalteromonas sp. 1_2015MBL_MicDiv]|uniref:hypothetical protein n=1 Tax=Pseudoalteromonas sp. 1_2015MBL_MicDiv TaxID=1720343 RepID=UPI0012FD8400|nr:hypothetical protein [Pseudoalteromonas sp. 1_2015MBL_MicDiv]